MIKCIQRLFIVCVMVMVTGCHHLAPNKPFPFQTYGQPGPSMVAVTMAHGFKKPGVYHVRHGTSLQTVLLLARPLPRLGWGAKESWCGGKVRQKRQGRDASFTFSDKPSSKEMTHVLEDGARVEVFVWNF